MDQHRLIVDPKLVQRDYDSVDGYTPERRKYYRLFYQLSHLTKDRGSLSQDDRVEALGTHPKIRRRNGGGSSLPPRPYQHSNQGDFIMNMSVVPTRSSDMRDAIEQAFAVGGYVDMN